MNWNNHLTLTSSIGRSKVHYCTDVRRVLFVVVLLLIQTLMTNVLASERTKEEMKMAALNTLSKSLKARGKTVSVNTSDLKEYVTMEKLSVIGNEDLGFAVVTNDDLFNEIIGYSISKFSMDMPCGLKWWMEKVNEIMQYTGKDIQFASRARKMKKTSMAPLMTTIWGQERPFNDNCTFTNNGSTYQCVTGCVATALAQVMNYYRFPTCGTGSFSYDITYNNSFTITYSEDFSQSYYDWDNMLDDYTSYYKTSTTDAHTQAVAKLMKDCGIAIKTNYSSSTYGSSASLWNAANALKTYFFYDSSTQHYSRSDYDRDEWMNMIFRELDNGRPILYRGSESNNTSSSGHAFVLHGYDSAGNVCVNWGWDGNCDGFYNIDMLNPDNNTFNYYQEMVIAIPGSSTDINTFHSMVISVDGPGCVGFGSSDGIQMRQSSQSFKIKEGNDATLVITPDAGCIIKHVIVNGSDVTSYVSDNKYIISDIYSDMTIEVEFEDWSYVGKEYNKYVTCVNTSSSANKIGFEITNSGSETISITKLVVRDPDTNTIIFTTTDSSVLGVLNSNSTRKLVLTTGKNVVPVYEIEYTVGNKDCFYVSSKYRILSMIANNYGYLKYADISVGSSTNKFSIIPNEQVIIEVVPKAGCELTKLMVNSSDVTSNLTNSQYTIDIVTSDVVVTATYGVISGNEPTIDGHEYVDLGLPSGKYWSTKNYGANLPEEAGTYYSIDSSSAWGDKWTTPSKDDFQELIDKCEWMWTELNGVNGFKIVGPNGNSIFLPAAGKQDNMSDIFGSQDSSVGSIAYYFTSSKGWSNIYVWLFSGNSISQKLIEKYIITERYPIRPVSTVIKELGDANGDGKIDATDIVDIVNYMMGRPTSTGKFKFDAADVNGDNAVNAADIVIIVNTIMSK